ncbi:sensor domain-containing diguanylate cyclase [Pseudomonas vanderleydeniana]|uniref:diguanylate cyclase n=1 Tax=Pseudomonas vanderleydeniana TaxID=2745495 RepID=A0A9E6TP68_9PSED|nr:sensor domain-containing diguanylate cyclase [Pseudomonas vanderleydeniana]QXI26113.1 sensor domain-containing diguanylate cyclase [Pseudomonas vanderleydeniana]
MSTRKQPRLKLRTLILLFALLSACVTLVNSLWVIYTVQRDAVISDVLEDNTSYAYRISVSVDQLLSADLSRLDYSADRIAGRFAEQGLVKEEISRLLGQDKSFNSVLVADAKGNVLVSVPASLRLDGKPLRDMEPILRRSVMISNAFRSIAGNLVVFLSCPVTAADGSYLGLVGGSVRLDEGNALHELIDQHVRHDGAFVYIVDRTGRILFHPDPTHVGTIADDAVTRTALRSTQGSLQTEEMLAGFASVPAAGWAVISQQPLSTTNGELQALMWKVCLGLIPLGILAGILIMGAGTYLSSPLARLATFAQQLDSRESYEQIRAIPVRFIEEWRIRRALLQSASLLQEKISHLNQQAQSDALTGLSNRRAMVDAIAGWQRAGVAFAVISVDIDHFKRVNDTWGHSAGDEALRVLAGLMRRCARKSDLACRVGGEEFMLLLPAASLAEAAEVAERLRHTVEITDIETVGRITISAGVARWQPNGESTATVFEAVDRLLYQAKESGRNAVVVQAPDSPMSSFLQ